jgi:hypothetical protein
VSQVPVSQFLTSQPMEDGTNCAAAAVIFSWEWVMTHIHRRRVASAPDCLIPGKGGPTVARASVPQLRISRLVAARAGCLRSNRPAGLHAYPTSAGPVASSREGTLPPGPEVFGC